MTTTEFERWIKQGLGRAVTRLRAETDKSPFYGVVLRVAKRQPGFTHCTVNYIYELIHCFNDMSELEAAAVESSGTFRDISYYELQGDDLLAMLYSGGNKAAGEKLGNLYNDILNELLARTERPERRLDKTGSYLVLSFRLAIADGTERLSKIFLDMGKLFTKRELFDENNFLFFFDNTRFRLKNVFDETLESLCAESQEVAQLADRIAVLRDNRMKNNKQHCVISKPDWSFEKLYEMLCNGENIPTEFYEHTNMLTDDQKQRIALLVNGENDLTRNNNILSIFVCNDVPWPLDPEPLVCMARKYLYSYGRDKPKCEEKLLTSSLISVLRNVRSDCVREFGFELIERGFVREGITLWAKNYHSDDRERFLKIFTQLDFDVNKRPDPMYEVLDLIRSGGFAEPKELLYFMYDNSFSENFRYVMLCETDARGMLTDEIIDECKHDNLIDIRELMEWREKHLIC